MTPSTADIRYADDFVVTAARKDILEQNVKPVIVDFLRDRGTQTLGRENTYHPEGKERVRQVCRMAQTVVERHIKVRGHATPYDPAYVEYFEKRRCFAWRTYPVGKTRAFGAGKDKIATQDASEHKPDCRITSAEGDLRKA